MSPPASGLSPVPFNQGQFLRIFHISRLTCHTNLKLRNVHRIQVSLNLNPRIYQNLRTGSVAFNTKYLFPRSHIHGSPQFLFQNVHDPEWPKIKIILMVIKSIVGHLGAQSVKESDYGSGHDLTAHEFKNCPTSGSLCCQCRARFGSSVPLSLCGSPTRTLSQK